ncbi:MAG: GNAT family protein [Burkholderiales bacterium]
MNGPSHKNALGQPIGFPLPQWTPPPHPPRTPLIGRYCRVEHLNIEQHAADLFAANALDVSGAGWTYLSCGPFADLSGYRQWMQNTGLGDDPLFHAIIDLQTQKPVGVASYLRIDRKGGAIEVGHLRYSPLMQRSPVATEAMYLMMKRIFDLGYRRYEWKCDSLNAPSRVAAQRLGFSYEGLFRQATINKNRNRDTAWFSIIDSEWPALNEAFVRWLAPENFDTAGKQKLSLSQLTAPLLKRRDDAA